MIASIKRKLTKSKKPKVDQFGHGKLSKAVGIPPPSTSLSPYEGTGKAPKPGEAAVSRARGEIASILRRGQTETAKISAKLKELKPELTTAKSDLDYKLDAALNLANRALSMIGNKGPAGRADRLHEKAADASDKSVAKEFQSQAEAALSEAEKALAGAVKAFEERVAGVINEVTALLVSPGKLAEMAEDALVDEQVGGAAPEYNALRLEVLEMHRTLVNWDSPEAQKVADFIDKCHAPIEAARGKGMPPYDKQLEQLKKIHEVAQLVIDQQESKYFEACGPVLEKLREVEQRAFKFEFAKNKKEIVEAEKAHLEQLVSIAKNIVKNGRNIEAMQAALPVIEEAMKYMDEIKSSGEEAKYIEQTLAVNRRNLNDKKIGGLFPDEKTRWEEKLAKLDKWWENYTVHEARVLVEEYGQAIAGKGVKDSMRQRALDRAEWIEKAKERVKQAKQDLKGVETNLAAILKVKKIDLKGEIVDELTAAEGMIEKESVVYVTMVNQKLDWVEAQIARFGSGAVLRQEDQDALKKSHEAGVKAEEDEAKALEKFKNDHKLSLADMKDNLGPLAKKNDSKKYSEIIKQAEDALKMVKKSKDIDTGYAMLRRARERLYNLAHDGPEVNHKSLGQIGEAWAKSLRQMMGHIDTLASAAAGAAKKSDRIPEPAANEVKPRLESVLKYFDPNVFDKPAGVLGDKNAGKAARKRAREEALRFVRLYISYIQTDPLMRHAVANHFGVGAVATAAYATLRKIEYEVTRAA